MHTVLSSHDRSTILELQREKLSATATSLEERLKSLWRITQFVRGVPPKSIDYAEPLGDDGQRFVEINSIANDHSFDEATLLSPFDDVAPQPTQPIQQSSLRPPSPQRARSPLSPISNPSRAAASQERISPVPEPSKHDSNSDLANLATATATPTPPRSPKARSTTDSQVLPSSNSGNLKDRASTDQPSGAVDLAKGAGVVPNEPRRKNVLPKPGERRAKVIHLPPKEHQEQHIREVERAQAGQRLREKREDEESMGLSVSVPSAVDVMSSPSSTAGAYSTSTPKPPQQSPDTSPDAEYSPGERVRLREASLDAVVQQGKEDAMDFTPEDQLRNEEEQASHKTLGSTQDSTFTRESRNSHPNLSQSQGDFQTPRLPTKARRSDNLEIDMIDAPSSTFSPMQHPSSEGPTRRMTRVASGAMRQKSVSEILGEMPKPTSALLRRDSNATPIDERSKHSMVVFSKSEPSVSPNRHSRYEPDGYLALKGAGDDPEKDYLKPLFLHQAYAPPRVPSLTDLISSSNKTLTTSHMYANIREGFDYRILRRIYQLQNANKWSFRQMAKFADPDPPVTHWDHLLAEMKWMRTDFREERKWKAAAARRMAEICATYVNSPDDVREAMRVKVKIPPRDSVSQETMEGVEEPPELVHSGSTDSSESLPDDEIEPFPTLPTTIAPAALFNLGFDDVVFELDPTPACEGILNELPLYESKPIEPAPFSSSKNSLIPVSKFTTGKLVPKPETILRKRSRYDYESEEDEAISRPTSSKRRASEVSMFLSPARRSPKRREIPPEETDVALFDPINRHIRDRLHANHAFRPPSEFPMPSTSFFEWRTNSQWTWDEDQKLRSAVKKFSYNWSLIAMELQLFSQPSIFVAAQERRTPWECFERWDQLEGLPNDMDKTQYFRTYRSRIQQGNRAVEARAIAAQQIAQQNGSQVAIRRRTETNPFRVPRRRDDRHIVMLDAIRKLARKRETNLHRQRESAQASALRKQHNEANQAKNGTIHTPQEFSRMKHEREIKLQERQELYRQQLLAQQQAKAQAMQRPGQPPNLPNGAQPQRTASAGSQGPSPPAQMTNGQPNGMPQRPTSANMMQNGFPNGVAGGMNMQMPNGQMQGMSNQQRLAAQNNPDLRILMAQQNASRQYQMQAHNNTANSLAAAHLGHGFQSPNPHVMAALAAQRQNAANGMGGANTSPRGQNMLNQPQQLSSGHTPALLIHQQRVAQEFPNFSPEQIKQLANERLKGQMQRMQATALSAASGSPANMNGMVNNAAMIAQMGNMNGAFNLNGMAVGNGQSSPQYAAALAQAQAQARSMQHQARMGSGSPAMSNAIPHTHPGSRSATPQGPQQTPQGAGMQIQRPGSAVAGMQVDESSPRML